MLKYFLLSIQSFHWFNFAFQRNKETSFQIISEKHQDFSLKSNRHQLMDEKRFICLFSLRV